MSADNSISCYFSSPEPAQMSAERSRTLMNVILVVSKNEIHCELPIVGFAQKVLAYQ